MTKRPASAGRFFLRIVGNTAILCPLLAPPLKGLAAPGALT